MCIRDSTLTIKDALKRWRPEAIRTFILSSHYGSPIDFSDEAVDAARAAFIARLDDDFNTPGGLAVLQDLTRQVNTLLNESGPQTQGTLAAIDALYRELGGEVLGIVPEREEGAADAGREDGLVRLLIDLRAESRAKKDWATGDTIRDRLKELGVVLEDRADGTIWKLS